MKTKPGMAAPAKKTKIKTESNQTKIKIKNQTEPNLPLWNDSTSKSFPSGDNPQTGDPLWICNAILPLISSSLS